MMMSATLLTRTTKTRRKLQSGFTLIEVMLVVLIIGLVAGFAMYTVDSSGPQNKLKRSAQKFVALTELALDKAVLSGRDFGIAFDQEQYHFVELVEQRWQPLQDKIFQEQSLEEIDISLEVEGFEWRPDLETFGSNELFGEREIDRDQDEIEKPHIPQLLILSSGELTPFTLGWQIASSLSVGLTERQQQYRVETKGNSLGLMTLEVRDEH